MRFEVGVEKYIEMDEETFLRGGEREKELAHSFLRDFFFDIAEKAVRVGAFDQEVVCEALDKIIDHPKNKKKDDNSMTPAEELRAMLEGPED